MTSDPAAAFGPLLRLAAFLGVFTSVALWEWVVPRRRRAFSRTARWPHNIALLAVDVAVVRVITPGAAIAVAMAGQAQGWGFLNAVALPSWAAIPVAVPRLPLPPFFPHILFSSWSPLRGVAAGPPHRPDFVRDIKPATHSPHS